MPLFQALPQKAIRIAQNSLTVVGANSDAPKAAMFTVPQGRKFTVLGVGCDQNVATVDLLATHVAGAQSLFVIDMPTERLPTDERIAPIYEVCNAGDSFNVGLRNGTAAPITPQLTVIYTDEPAS